MLQEKITPHPGKPRGIARRMLLAGATSIASFPAIRAEAQTAGVALVVGNSKYHWEASLPNVKRDTPEIARALQALGLKTELVQDAGKDTLQRAIERFAVATRDARVAVFYFAGHGATWENTAYIAPVDADLGDPNNARNLTPVQSIVEAAKEASNGLLVFDSCRNNPADGWKQRVAERVRSNAVDAVAAAARKAQHTVVLYSTAPGRIALDGPAGDYSPFAAAFLRELGGEQLDLQGLPARLRRRLLIATGGRQVLWDHGAYLGRVRLRRVSSVKSSSRPSDVEQGHSPPGLVELDNAYSYAQHARLVLPSGLVAFRPNGNSPDARKIGSYKHDWGVPKGVYRPDSGGGHPGYFNVPALMAVLSVTNGIAEVVTSVLHDTGGKESSWGLHSAPVSGNRLAYRVDDERIEHEFTWRTDDGGNFHHRYMRANAPSFSSRFARIDG